MKYKFDMIQNGHTVCSSTWGMKNESAIFHRIYYVYGGEGYCKCGGEVVQLKEGHLYLFPVMQTYTLYHNIDNPLDVLWFHVDMEAKFWIELSNIEVEKNSILKHILDAMEVIIDNPEYFSELLDLFGIFLCFVGEKLPVSQYNSQKMQKVLDYIEQNIGGDISVEKLSESVCMDRSYFSRKFKSLFHMSPTQYILAKKMNAAALELISGASIYQSARVAGYEDEKAFSRAFKKYMEVSPGKYRKSHIVQP